MKSLNLDQMASTKGGSWQSFITDLGCMGVGMSYGLVNPILGLVMGVGCSLVVYHSGI